MKRKRSANRSNQNVIKYFARGRVSRFMPPVFFNRMPVSVHELLVDAAANFKTVQHLINNVSTNVGVGINYWGKTSMWGIYNTACVYAWDITMEAINLDTDSPAVVVCRCSPNTTAPVDDQDALNNPGSKHVTLANSGGQNRGKVRVYTSVKSLYGANPIVEEDFWCKETEDPARSIALNITAYNMTGVANLNVSYMLTVNAYVKWSNVDILTSP